MKGPEQPVTAQIIMELAQEVQDAQKAHDEKRQAADQASRDETSALNLLNIAQKHFDEVLQKFQAQSSRDSDWARSKKEEVEA